MLILSATQQRALDDFRMRWHITELSFFGSAIRADFDEQSDVDILVDFAPGHTPGFAFMRLCRDLTTILGRQVDVFTRAGLDHAGDPAIQRRIMAAARDHHAAQPATLS